MTNGRAITRPWIAVLALTAAMIASGCATDSNPFGSGTGGPLATQAA